jgi:hypothetical protein
MAGPPFPIPNLQAPSGVVGLDNVTGANGASNVANYALQTAGTNTITTGRSSAGGIYLGAQVVSGTGNVYQAFDVVGTVTNPITALTTATLGQTIGPGPAGVGVRFLGTLVTVITGTGTTNTLWD